MVCSHLLPTRNRERGVTDPEALRIIANLRRHARRTGINFITASDPRQGIHHVLAVEQGLSLPGFVIAVTDSHTTTHGALGALGLGLGYAEATQVLATQTLWQPRYAQMRINIDGVLGYGVTAKDLALALIGQIGADGATGCIVEFCGPTVQSMNMEARQTLCNLFVEAGAPAGIIAPDDTTIDYLHGRAEVPKAGQWDTAVEYWSTLHSDAEAKFSREVSVDARKVVPLVTWGTSPEDVLPVDGIIPDPATETDLEKRQQIQRKLDYMGLRPGMSLSSVKVDQVFIGSCTNGRLDDLSAAADVLRGNKATVPGLVVPGSVSIQREAESRGLDKIFIESGFEWGALVARCAAERTGDIVAPGRRCASSTNRNFEGRQGPGSRTHLMSPAMAAAAAITGYITDVRRFTAR